MTPKKYARCRICGNRIRRWQPNRKLCSQCAKASIQESKRLWQAQWRARNKRTFDRDEGSQRAHAAYDADFETIVLGDE